MKKHLLKKNNLSFMMLCIIVALSLANQGGRARIGREGNTGAPGDKGYNCSNCHAGGNYNVAGDLYILDSLGNAVDAYIPGEKYVLSLDVKTISGTVPNGFGFQVLGLKKDNNQALNAFTSPSTDAQLATINNRQYFEHNKASKLSRFTATWQAPESGSGSVSFFGVLNAVNSNFSTSGDKVVSLNTISLTEATNHTNAPQLYDLTLFPSPAYDVITLELPTLLQEKHSIQVIDMHGKCMTTITNGEKSIDVSAFTPGIYFVEIKNEKIKRIALKRFIKL